MQGIQSPGSLSESNRSSLLAHFIICKASWWSLCARAGIRGAEEPHKYVYKQNDRPFSFEISRSGASPGEHPEPIWNTTGHRLIFKEQYLEMTSSAPASSTMYGLGERISSSGKHGCMHDCLVSLAHQATGQQLNRSVSSFSHAFIFKEHCLEMTSGSASSIICCLEERNPSSEPLLPASTCLLDVYLTTRHCVRTNIRSTPNATPAFSRLRQGVL